MGCEHRRRRLHQPDQRGVYSGSTTDTLTISGATAAMNGYQYEAVFTNTAARDDHGGHVEPATVPIVTTQPTTQTVNAGSTATFTAAASGKPGSHRPVEGQHRQRHVHPLPHGRL